MAYPGMALKICLYGRERMESKLLVGQESIETSTVKGNRPGQGTPAQSEFDLPAIEEWCLAGNYQARAFLIFSKSSFLSIGLAT